MNKETFIEFIGNCCILVGLAANAVAAPSVWGFSLNVGKPVAADFMLCLGLLFHIALGIEAWWSGSVRKTNVACARSD